MRKVVLLAVFSILFSNISSTNAVALEKCFAELPDSEWIAGQPTLVTNSLNYDLVGTVTSNPDVLTVSKNWNLPVGMFFDNTNFETVYRYIGKTCAERIIKVPGTFSDFTTNPISEIEDKIKNSAINFEVGEKNLQTFRATASSLSKVKANANVFSNGLIKGKWLDWSWENKDFTKFQELFGPSRSSFINNLDFNGIFYRIQNGCAEFSYISDLNTDKAPVMVGTPQLISQKWGAMFVNFNSTKTCLIDTFMVFGNSGNFKIYNFATFSLKPIGKLKNTVINCKNGNTTKKVTALRPKCPVGFIKK
jgi:hypothetical protein